MLDLEEEVGSKEWGDNMMHEVTNEHNHMPQRGHSMLRAVWPSAGRPAGDWAAEHLAEHFMHVNVRCLLAPALAPPRAGIWR